MKIILLSTAAFALATFASAEEIVIQAGTLITDARSPALAAQTLVVENGVIVRIIAGYTDQADAIDLSCCVVSPGFIDMHTHVTLVGLEDNPRLGLLNAYASPKSMTVLAAAGRTRELLQLGFTTIRNLGDPSNVSRDLRDAIGLGQVEGPRMIVAGGAQIGVSGGDYDPGALRLSESAEALALTEGQCDSVEACRKAVRSAFGRGADVIKMRLSSVSLVKTNVKRLERQDEINAIVETAHDLGLRVATHASTDDRAAMAIAAGADTIEHSPLSALSIAAMKTNGTAYTPTLQAAKQLGPMIKAVTGKDYFADASASAREAYEAGVPVLLGSDLGAVSVSDVPLEFERLAEAGIPLDGVLAAGTSAAAKALGMSDRIGAIKSGMAADIVAMQLNPLDDASAYGTVVFVMKGGKVYRDDLQTVPFDK
jgi:imidazolonepropionase-like amidohydrolase